ncbi:hypothetical protein MPOCJGCO_1184 [Methylobacterium trifolii]|uniref:Uncharacterized protein n=1 Tax=Methylobacterium trifolii TaxID=1003092 RepID=A0ABQ4TWM8_9HYPH|nr:hypothetical protein MPOCJGCO_1184 [Methylobacterium trifolii]
MTGAYERRIRNLETRHRPSSGNMVVLGIPGRPEPSFEEIIRTALVLRVTFVAAKDGRLAEGEHHARH